MERKFGSIVAALLAAFMVAAGSVNAQDTNAPDKKDTDVVKDWHGSVALGLSMARGNSDTLMFNASAVAEKDWKKDEWRLGADAAYGLNNWAQTNETASANNMHGFVDYKHLYTERFYVGANADALHDDVAKVRYRLIIGPYAGYYFIKSDVTRLSGEIGPSYVKEKLGSESESYLALRISERFQHEFSKTCKVWEQIDYLPKATYLANYLLNTEVGTEVAINTRLSLRVVALDKYNSRPTAGTKNNDILLLASIVWKFGQ
jgi:putative salt-induced outer membrane protein YdiY